MIADTGYFIDLLAHDAGAQNKTAELERAGQGLSTAAPVVFELWRGFGLLDARRAAVAAQLLDQLEIFSLDMPAAKRAGQVERQLKDAGLAIDPEDAMIAGIALAHNETVLTRNVKHFLRIPDLSVKSY